MLNFDYPNINSSNCMYSSYKALLKYINADIIIFDLNQYITRYFNNRSDSLTENINEPWNLRPFDLLSQYYGLKATRHEQISNPLKFIEQELNKFPVALWVDCYDCYWLPMYNQRHYNHLMLINEIDYCNKRYICSDLYFNTIGYVYFDFDLFLKSKPGIITFEYNANKVKRNSFDFICEQVLVDEDVLKSQKQDFINFIEKDFSIEREKKDLSMLKSSVLCLKFLWILEGKQHFLTSLEKFYNLLNIKFNECLYENIENEKKEFKKLTSLIIKSSLSLKEEKTAIVHSVENIYKNDFSINYILREDIKI